MAHTRHTTYVAFAPGFMQRGEAWTPFAGEVARRGWPSALVDYGEPTLDACLSAITDAADGGVVVGYSMGGRLALQAAVREPYAFAGMVLIGATPGIEDPAQRRQRSASDAALADWMARQRIDSVVDLWQRQPIFGTQSDELIREQRPGRLGHKPEWLAELLRAVGQGVVEPVWDQLDSVEIPVLAIAGELDPKYAQVAVRMAERLPNARAAIVPKAGHAPQLEQHVAVANLLLEFLHEHFGDNRIVDGDAQAGALGDGQ